MRDEHPAPTILVWDVFVRIFHWSLAANVMVAYYFTEDGDLPHQIAGYLALALVSARIVWGFVGTPFARFSQFLPSPRALRIYLISMARLREPRFLGHNPAGAVMVLLLLMSVLIAGITGWLMTTEAFWGVEWMQTLHRIISDLLMWFVAAHLVGVIYTSWRHRENLVRAMLTGFKTRH